jgi:membrane peptidoglycan carboxypeptidase
VYALAFENGLDPESYVFDTPTEFNPNCAPADGTRREQPCYSPQNYDGGFLGGMTLREALGNSRNIPAVKVLYLVGVNNVTKFAKKLGITSMTQPERYGLSLVLGGAEVSLLQLTGSYLPFGQEGIYRKPVAILEVKDKSGKVLYEYEDAGYQVMSNDTAGKITSTLSDNGARVRVFGPSSQMHFPGRDVAVKTGTTNNFKDGWVVGYTTDYVVGSWIGKNDNTQIGEVTASLSVVPMWNQMMYKLFRKNEPGTLSKDYTPNPSVDGPNCQGATAYDLIYTAISTGNFGLSRNDPLTKYWFVGNSAACAPIIVETAGSSSAVILPVDQNFPAGNPSPTIQLPTDGTPVGTTNPPTQN